MLYNLILSSLLLIIVLFSISPVIDHAFPPLDEEKADIIIFTESILHIITIVFILVIINTYIISNISNYFKLDIKILTNAKPVITSMIMVGLQSHLLSKLKYLTHKHPFRFLNIYK